MILLPNVFYNLCFDMNFCLNIDWFEVFTYEPSWCTGAEWYQSLGYTVVMRDYGTRVYREMFTLFTPDGQPWLEVRRCPLSAKSRGGILDDRACSMRLVNRACYESLCIPTLWDFLRSHGFVYKDNVCALSRVDICCDFTSLSIDDSPVFPAAFMSDYLAGVYYKVNQPRVRAYGTEHADGMHYHQISWGSPSSSVSCKLYNKSLELAEGKMKPYIVDSWLHSGVLSSEDDDSAVFRLEFSLRAGSDSWISDKDSEYYMANTIDAWLDTSNYIRFYNGLLRHYFQFAVAEVGVPKYKCRRVFPLGNLSKDAYRPVKRVSSARDSGRSEKMVINKLERLRDSGAIDKRYIGAINSVLYLFYDVYSLRRTKRLSSDDDVLRSLDNLISSYNDKLIMRLFDRLMSDSRNSLAERYAMETVYAMYQRDKHGLACTLLQKPPYSITAVEFSPHNTTDYDKRVTVKLLQKKLDWLQHGDTSAIDRGRWRDLLDTTAAQLAAARDLVWDSVQAASGRT